MSSLNDSNDTQEELSAEKKKKFHLVGLLKGLAKFFFGNVWIVLISVILAFVAWFAISVNEFPEIDKSLIEAASDLGCNPVSTLFRVVVPLSVPGIMSGVTMVFVPAISTFIISRMLGGGSNLLIGDLIEQQFLGSVYNPNVGSAMSLILMIVILLIMGVINHFDDEEMEGMLV